MKTVERLGDALRVRIDETLDAAGVEQLMRRLALLRADMQPPVPTARDPDASTIAEENPALLIATLRNGGVRLWLRHRGYGWLAWQLDDRSAIGIARYIASRCVAPDGQAIEFIGDQGAHRH